MAPFQIQCKSKFSTSYPDPYLKNAVCFCQKSSNYFVHLTFLSSQKKGCFWSHLKREHIQVNILQVWVQGILNNLWDLHTHLVDHTFRSQFGHPSCVQKIDKLSSHYSRWWDCMVTVWFHLHIKFQVMHKNNHKNWFTRSAFQW